jgi:hypothetical protein
MVGARSIACNVESHASNAVTPQPKAKRGLRTYNANAAKAA